MLHVLTQTILFLFNIFPIFKRILKLFKHKAHKSLLLLIRITIKIINPILNYIFKNLKFLLFHLNLIISCEPI